MADGLNVSSILSGIWRPALGYYQTRVRSHKITVRERKPIRNRGEEAFSNALLRNKILFKRPKVPQGSGTMTSKHLS